MVNFNIVENYSHEHKFPAFKEDYLKGMTKKDICKKHDIPKSVWTDFKSRMPPRLHSRNSRPKRSPILRNRRCEEGYLLKNTPKRYVTILRWVQGVDKYLSYGTYPNMETADKVAKLMVECDWDKYKAYDLLQEYAVPNSKRVLSSRLLKR